ncbi:MAG TPA: hypothetical protein VFD63_13830, partial [Pyrinomonadaceae bacterium]|nr:hypothetical protein [Pyrinomonadaceae bacterium]
DIKTRCPRCERGRLKSWSELSDDEQIVANRLPGSVEVPANERKTTHRWCTECWFEEKGRNTTRNA